METQKNTEAAFIEKIKAIKQKLGKKLIILTHHYQRKEIVDLGDHKGDSFDLSKKAANDKDAEFIVFCGVHFMADSYLKDSFCPNMFKINLRNLLSCLENIGKTNIVKVDEAVKKEALIALENMLNL